MELKRKQYRSTSPVTKHHARGSKSSVSRKTESRSSPEMCSRQSIKHRKTSTSPDTRRKRDLEKNNKIDHKVHREGRESSSSSSSEDRDSSPEITSPSTFDTVSQKQTPPSPTVDAALLLQAVTSSNKQVIEETLGDKRKARQSSPDSGELSDSDRCKPSQTSDYLSLLVQQKSGDEDRNSSKSKNSDSDSSSSSDSGSSHNKDVSPPPSPTHLSAQKAVEELLKHPSLVTVSNADCNSAWDSPQNEIDDLHVVAVEVAQKHNVLRKRSASLQDLGSSRKSQRHDASSETSRKSHERTRLCSSLLSLRRSPLPRHCSSPFMHTSSRPDASPFGKNTPSSEHQASSLKHPSPPRKRSLSPWKISVSPCKRSISSRCRSPLSRKRLRSHRRSSSLRRQTSPVRRRR